MVANILLCLFCLVFSNSVYPITKGSSTAVSVQDHYVFKASGSNNLMNTFGYFKNGFGLDQPSATCTFQSVFPVSGNVSLHGGSLTLLSDLIFSDITNLETGGSFICKGYMIDLAGSITGIPAVYDTSFDDAKIFLRNSINLDGAVQFNGECVINGGGNAIQINRAADIRVGSDSSVTFCNVNLNGLSVKNLRCLSDNSSIIFQDCHLMLARDYVFDKGHLGFKSDVIISGTVKFSYASGVTSTIYSGGLLTLDPNITFSYDPASPRNDLICFEDECSMLYLNGSTVRATPTGILLSKGNLIVNQSSKIYSKSLSYPDGSVYTGGVVFGKNDASDDCKISILPGAILKVPEGDLHYRNVRSSSWKMASALSTLYMKSGANLILDQTLTVRKGKIQSHYTSFLIKKSGVNLIGDVEIITP